MPNILQFPRGYCVAYDTIGDQSNYHDAVDGDVEFNTVYNAFINHSANHDGWEFRSLVLKIAIRMFGDFRKWLALQAKNPALYGNNYDFLHDTLKFITTGERNVSVLNWLELLTEQPANLPQGNLDRRIDELLQGTGFGISVTTEQIIAQWCSQPMGFEDMLCTMHVLFGKARVTPLHANTNCN